MLPIRVFFVKKGDSVYISHLDVQRAVIRALQRTGYKLAFTEGFNPHLKLVFAMPLSLFQQSTYEIFDFTLLDNDVTYDEVLEKLKKNFPEDMMPFAVSAPKQKLSALRMATYDIFVKTHKKQSEIALPDVMTVIKKSKSGIKEIDIRPFIRSFEVSDTEDGVKLCVTADCGSQSHLNVAYICEWFGFENEDFSIVRTGLYDGVGELIG